jgi:hypothetical protein
VADAARDVARHALDDLDGLFASGEISAASPSSPNGKASHPSSPSTTTAVPASAVLIFAKWHHSMTDLCIVYPFTSGRAIARASPGAATPQAGRTPS